MIAYNNIASALLLVITAGLSLYGIYRNPKVVEQCLFRPYYFLRKKQYDTMFTSGLVHADFNHLLFNMVTFYFFAFPMERFIGTVPFVILYAIGLIGSHTCTYVKHKNHPEYASLGASGAISAVLFAYIVYFPTTTLIIFPIPLPIPAALFAVAYVGYSYWASSHSNDRVNHDAHLCGAFSGLAYVAVTDISAYTRLLGLFG